MAERRMFSRGVVQSDSFLNMPLSSQALYFHLGLEADDDGFLGNVQKIVRMIGASKDDFSILMAKGFVIPLTDGVCVIRHWKLNNFIRNDRYKQTIYVEQKHMLSTAANGVYCLAAAADSGLHHLGIPDGNQMDTNGQPSIGKVSIDKYIPPLPPRGERIEGFDEFYSVYPKKQGRQGAIKAWNKLNPDTALRKTILLAVEKAKHSQEWQKDRGQFIPMPATYLNGRRWEDAGTEIILPSSQSRYKTLTTGDL